MNTGPRLTKASDLSCFISQAGFLKVVTPYKLVALALTAIAVYFAAHLYSEKRLAWEEDVILPDGNVVQISQVRKYKKVMYEMTSVAWETKSGSIKLPSGQRFDWQGALAPVHLVRGSAAGSWLIIAAPLTCETHNAYGRPRPDYVQFELKGDQWVHQQVDKEFIGQKSNLLGNMAAIDSGLARIVSLSDKAQWNNSLAVDPRYLEVSPTAEQDSCPSPR